MKRLTLAFALAACLGISTLAVQAAPITLIGSSPDISSGSMTVAPGNWVKTGGGPNVTINNDRNGPDGGDFMVGGADGSGSSPSWENYYSQSFALTGVWEVSLSGYSKAWAGWWSGENWNWVQEASLELWVDGVLKFEGLSANNLPNRDTWNYWTHVETYNIVNGIEVRLRSKKGNDNFGQGSLGAIFYNSRFDDVNLTVVPEPSSLLALAGGIAGMAGFAFRRKS